MNQQHGHDSENVEADCFDGNRSLPSLCEGRSVKVFSENSDLVRELEEVQPKEHVQQNAAAGDDQDGDPKRPVG
jgi:hypothetical protein